MSLVNDMLRDLNKRTPVSSKAARVHGAMHSSVANKRSSAKGSLMLAGGLLVGLGAGYFYFQAVGGQVVPVPQAMVPAPPATLAPSVQVSQTPTATTAVEANTTDIAPRIEDALAAESLVEIRELALQPNGFTLLIEASRETTFDIRDRSAYGLTLHLDGVDRYDRAGTTVPGMSLMLVSDGLDIGIELNEATDFLVREDAETPGFDILLTASYRTQDLASANAPPAADENDPITNIMRIETTAADRLADQSAAPRSSQSQALSLSPGDRPVRVNRELSLEDRDSNNSQAAVRLVQGGQLAEAHESLTAFLAENPSAHQSRETLATLLLARLEYAEANKVIDQGLELVPNYASFKKIKARLLMQENAHAQALSLLRNLPPAAAVDSEYHELLASLLQQGNYHREAVTTYQELLRTNARQGRWWAGLGISFEALEEPAKALSSYQAALQTEDLDAGVRQYIQNRMNALSSQ